MGSFNEALPSLKILLIVILAIVMGACHNDGLTWKSAQSRADSLWSHGNYRAALPVADRAVELAESAFGSDDRRVSAPLALRSCVHLAFLDYPEAMSDAERSLKLVEEAHIPNDTLILQPLVAVAVVHLWLHHYDTAARFFQRVVDLQERTSAPRNPYWQAWALTGLAEVEYHTGSFVKGREYCYRAIDILQDEYGPDHPLSAYPHVILAWIADASDDLAEAVRLDSQAIAIRLKSYDESHPYIADARLQMAHLFRLMHRYHEAEMLLSGVIDSYEKTFGMSHPRLAIPMIYLFRLYYDQKRYRDAEGVCRRAIGIADTSRQRTRLGAAILLEERSQLRQKEKMYGQADSLLMESLKIRMNLFGKESEEAGDGFLNLGRFHLEIADYHGAETYLGRAGRILESHYPSNGRKLRPVLAEYAKLYAAQHNDSGAERLYRRAVNECEIEFGAGTPLASTYIDAWADLYRKEGRYPQADSLYRRLIAINRDKVWRGGWVASGTLQLAELRQEEGKPADADTLFRSALACYARSYGHENSRLIPAYDSYARFLRSTGRDAVADSITRLADALRR